MKSILNEALTPQCYYCDVVSGEAEKTPWEDRTFCSPACRIGSWDIFKIQHDHKYVIYNKAKLFERW